MANSNDEKIWKTIASIPSGYVATYGQIADLAGMGRAARQVGRALRNTPKGVDIPWHRVINASGRISLPQDSDAYRTQRERLLMEGVVFKGRSVDLNKFQWQPALDELLWGLDG